MSVKYDPHVISIFKRRTRFFLKDSFSMCSSASFWSHKHKIETTSGFGISRHSNWHMHILAWFLKQVVRLKHPT